ncbi:MAG: hypothetical protein GF329_14170 [Candidatus Lokiarchaeota archaeon]|nr:hypothetical protein [Candidatus Lokiarchaeota archaeon]
METTIFYKLFLIWCIVFLFMLIYFVYLDYKQLTKALIEEQNERLKEIEDEINGPN